MALLDTIKAAAIKGYKRLVEWDNRDEGYYQIPNESDVGKSIKAGTTLRGTITLVEDTGPSFKVMFAREGMKASEGFQIKKSDAAADFASVARRGAHIELTLSDAQKPRVVSANVGDVALISARI